MGFTVTHKIYIYIYILSHVYMTETTSDIIYVSILKFTPNPYTL